MRYNYLDVEDVIYIYEDVVAKKYVFDQPNIPSLATYDTQELKRIVEAIESITKLPSQVAFGRALYPTLEEKGAILFITLTKNHIFRNGNKRTAVYALFLFMWMNCHWLDFKHLELYAISKRTASKDSIEVSFESAKSDLVYELKSHIGRLPIENKTFKVVSKNKNIMREIYSKIIRRNE